MNVLTHGISRKKVASTLGLISTLMLPSIASAGLDVSNPSRKYEVTVIKGADLPITGQPIEGYSVMAIENGKLSPIPFQFDDINTKGLPFVPGAAVKIDGIENIFEAKDELAFMYKDMGEKGEDSILKNIQGTLISELEITEDGTSRYAYLVKGNAERSNKVYAHYDFETGVIETETYSIKFDPENITVWSDWKIKGFAGTHSAPKVLDTMKARFFIRLGFIKATLHNAILPAKTLAVKNGPIRSIVEADISIGALGIDILSGGVSATLTPGSIRFPIFALFPKAASVLSELLIDVTLDYVDFEGTRYKTPLGPDEPLIAGQKVSDKVREQYKSNFENPWVSISSGHNWDAFLISRFSEGFNPTVSALYYDEGAGDKPIKPENVKGSSAEMGIRLSDIPVGNHVIFEHSVYFGPDLWQGNSPKRAANAIFNPAKVSIKNFQP